MADPEIEVTIEVEVQLVQTITVKVRESWLNEGHTFATVSDQDLANDIEERIADGDIRIPDVDPRDERWDINRVYVDVEARSDQP